MSGHVGIVEGQTPLQRCPQLVLDAKRRMPRRLIRRAEAQEIEMIDRSILREEGGDPPPHDGRERPAAIRTAGGPLPMRPQAMECPLNL